MSNATKQIRYNKLIHYVRRAVIIVLLYQLHSFLYNSISAHAIHSHINLMTSFDHLIPFVPWMVYPYMSLYLGIFLAAVFLERRAFVHFVGILFFSELLTYPFFYYFPAVFPTPQFAANDFTTRFLQWCFKADVHNNTFPSLHVSLALSTALVINRSNKKIGFFAILWAITVAFSTVLTKKHFFIDVLGGVIVAQLAYTFAVKNNLSVWLLSKAKGALHNFSQGIDKFLEPLSAKNHPIFKTLTMLLIFIGLK